MVVKKFLFSGSCILLAGLALLSASANSADTAEARKTHRTILLSIEGPIGPAIAHHIVSGLKDAAQDPNPADLVILRMDTPGGLATSMRDIIKAVLASPVPVVSYVAPQGARAASAGTYILYASHIAAMAPATNLGAATPVPVGGAPTEKPDLPTDTEKAEQGEESAMHQKVVNDAVAYIRGLAALRGRNADWAERAVREAASLPAEKALEMNVIDVMALDVADLLQKIDGKSVIIDGETVTLDTDNMVIETIETDWRTELLSILTNPTIAYMLMLAGIYGLMFEGFNPGAILPGVFGAICLLLALFAFQLLPVNYAGVALILLGIGFMIGEMFVPSFGALGLGGLIAFTIGSIILMDTNVPGYDVSSVLIGSLSIGGGALLLLLTGFAARAHKQKVVSGSEQMVGLEGTAIDDFENHHGRVMARGEMWQAIAKQPVLKGQTVRVVLLQGLILNVEPVEATAMSTEDPKP